MRLCINARQHADYAAKLQIVNAYVASFTTKTMQGSVGWQYKRAVNIVGDKPLVTIGGSEVPTVIGKNKFRSVDALVVEKVAFLTTGIIPDRTTADMVLKTQWGHICEPYSRIFICDRYDCNFYEIQESILHPREERVRYSPDGVGVIRVEVMNNERAMIALLELKNPFERIIKPKTFAIPDYYEPQVDTGIDVIPIAEIGMYVECCFRCQPLRDFGKPVYNGRIHFKSSVNGKKGAARYEDLHVYGSVLAFFYEPKLEGPAATDAARQLSALIDLCIEHAHDGLIDFGATDESLLALMMAQVYKGHLKHYSFDRVDMIEDDGDRRSVISGDIADFTKWCDDNGVRGIGVMPMSIFEYGIVLRQKRPNYVESIKSHIDRYTARVHDEVERAGGFHAKFAEMHALSVAEQLGSAAEQLGSAAEQLGSATVDGHGSSPPLSEMDALVANFAVNMADAATAVDLEAMAKSLAV